MTKGQILGVGQGVYRKRFAGSCSRAFSEGRLARRCAVGMAVWAAIQTTAQAAESVMYPEPQIVPVEATDYSVQPQQPMQPEPAPPGEGPGPNDIDVVVLGDEGHAKDFWKPEVHFGATVGAVFQDNVFITNTNKVSDVILVASARATIAFGNVESWASQFIDTSSRALAAVDDEDVVENLVAITYAPTANFFMDNDNLNTVDEDVAATFRWTFSKLQVAFDGRVQTLSDPDEDLGRRADRTVIRGNAKAIYAYSEKTSLQFNASVLDRLYDIGTDSLQVDGSAFLLYQLMPKTRVGLGIAAGELELDGGNTQTYEQALLRVQYNSFSKLAFNATGGGEIRQNEGGSDEVNSTFQIGVTYQLANDTAIYFSALQRIDPSSDRGSTSIQRTSFSLGLNQRLFQKLSLSANIDYGVADYSTNSNNADSGRSDKLLGFSATLTFEVTQNGFARLGYIYRQDDSSLVRTTYDANQVILSFTALF